jgi:hypothetical protein
VRKIALSLIVISIIGYLIWDRYSILKNTPTSLEKVSSIQKQSNEQTVDAPLSPKAKYDLLLSLPEAHLADNLNAPANTLRQDVSIVCSMLAAWRSIYRKSGNPVGNNQDLVRAFLGDNPNGVIFLSPDNPAINKKGELCDRYGHPFFFHAESGTHMEVRSAGPDGVLFTSDDVYFTP